MADKVLSPVVIRPFEAGDAEAFRVLNEAWISTLFRLEEKDREVLNDPVGKILAPGGQIFIAERRSLPAGIAVRDVARIGCCALIAMSDGSFELAKMAVAEQERGRGVGRQILEYVVREMRSQGARRLYLETNSSLGNAIHLYEEAGFRRIDPAKLTPSGYERADVFMELVFDHSLSAIAAQT
jgi:putative acetyltransferase